MQSEPAASENEPCEIDASSNLTFQHVVKLYWFGIAWIVVNLVIAVYVQWLPNPHFGWFYALAFLGMAVVTWFASRDPAIKLIKPDGDIDRELVNQFFRLIKQSVLDWFDAQDANAPNTWSQRLKALLGIYVGSVIVTVPICVAAIPWTWYQNAVIGFLVPLGVMWVDLDFGSRVSRWHSTTCITKTFVRGVVRGVHVTGIYLFAVMVIVGMGVHGKVEQDKKRAQQAFWKLSPMPVRRPMSLPISEGPDTEKFWQTTATAIYSKLNSENVPPRDLSNLMDVGRDGEHQRADNDAPFNVKLFPDFYSLEMQVENASSQVDSELLKLSRNTLRSLQYKQTLQEKIDQLRVGWQGLSCELRERYPHHEFNLPD